MVGQGSPQSNMMRLLDASPSNGAQTIVIRCGDKGALAVTRRGLHEGSILGFMLPAVEGTQVVDVTGCGNAFCGGFLASFIGMTGEAGDLLQSMAWGNTAASFMAEEKGVPKIGIMKLKEKALQRFGILKGKAQQLHNLRSKCSTAISCQLRQRERRSTMIAWKLTCTATNSYLTSLRPPCARTLRWF